MDMNTIEKIRAEIERLKSNLVRGASASQICMETLCKEEAYNEILFFINSMKDEPVHYTKRNELFDKCVANIDPNTLKEVEEQTDKKLQNDSNEYLKQEAEFYWKKQGGGSHAQWDKFVKVVKHFTEWQKNQIRFYIEGALSVCENEDRKDFGEMVLDYINTL